MNPLQDIDWQALWEQREQERKLLKDAHYWDTRAKAFGSHCKQAAPDKTGTGLLSGTDKRPVPVLSGAAPVLSNNSGYDELFIAALGLKPGERVLDMGCGNGALAVPLAQEGHEVLACDFSPAMLAALSERCKNSGVTSVTPRILAWEDNWEAAGVAPKSVDVAFASRSLMTRDLWTALTQLSAAARRKAAITLYTCYTPLSAVATPCKDCNHCSHDTSLPDHIFGINLLFKMGYLPQVSYIDSSKRTREGTLSIMRWAFISWDV